MDNLAQWWFMQGGRGPKLFGGQLYSFNGINDYILTPDESVFDLTTSLTIYLEAQYAPISPAPVTTFRTLIGDQHSVGSWRWVWDSTSEEFEFVFSDPTARVKIPYSFAALSSAVRKLVCTYDGAATTMRMYADGVPIGVSTAAPATLVPRDYPVYIGWDGDATKDRYWADTLGRVQVWNRVLSGAELAMLHEGRDLPDGRVYQLL